ncbi:MAG: 16S rRNA (adenine(1518)-N(6)/adenine(1519)-N(6)) -dimethyltransferase RsmA [Rhodothalassiaceae bacterium]
MTIADLPPLRETIARHGLKARKSLGQNFLLDLNLTGRIARAAGPLAGRMVYEVGPGPGGLTRALLMAGADHVTAVERDPRAIPALAEIAAAEPGRLTVLEADAMTIDEAALADGRPLRIVANLPYHIGTALLVRWLRQESWPPPWESLTLMFQREVAERICAAPGSKSYGRLSVLAQWRSRARLLFTVPASAFTPPPKVMSAVVGIEPLEAPDPALGLAALERVTEAAFAQRRKMLRASLRSLVAKPEALLDAAGIDPTARAETVDIAGFCRLARLWQDLSRDRTGRAR